MKRVPESTIIATFAWPYSALQIVHNLRALGYSVTTTHVKEVWDRARQRGDLPPIERPAHGFDPRRAALVQTLKDGVAA